MRTLKGLLPVVFLLLLMFFGYSLWIAPFSVTHGYYVGAAKHMAQGLVPWQDINLMDLPLGVWLLSLPYRLFGVEVCGTMAVLFTGMIQLVNLVLLRALLKNVGIRSTVRWITLIFYVVVLYSTDVLYTNIETFSITFLLLTLLMGKGKRYGELVLAAACFVLAVFCKAQMIVMLPATLLFVFLPLKGKRVRFQKTLLFLALGILFGIAAFISVSVYTGEAHLIGRLDWHFYSTDNLMMKMLVAVAIVFVRCSLYIMLPGMFGLFTTHRRTRYYAWILFLAFAGELVLLFTGCDKVTAIFLYPFVALCYGWTLQDLWERKHWTVNLFFLLSFVIPGYLVVREFQKLELGDVKERQEAYLGVLREMYPNKTEVALMTYECVEFDLSSQIYSEIPTIEPFDKKHTKWGLNRWEYVPEGDYVIRAIVDAPVIITNEKFLLWYLTLSSMTNQSWSSDFHDFFQKNQENMYAIGDLSVLETN